MTISRYATAKTIVNGAAAEVGLTPVASPYSSLDPAFVSFITLLNSCGMELIGEANWRQLRKTHTINATPSDSGEYTLPNDFARVIPRTGWDRTNRWPLGGPLTDSIWNLRMYGGSAGVTTPISLMFTEGEVWTYPKPVTANTTIAFDYIGLGWVLDEDGVTEKSLTEEDSDVVRFPPVLMQKMLRYRWLTAKGFKADSAAAEFQHALSTWVNNEGAAPVLSILGGAFTEFRLLDSLNIPDTGYGS